MFRRHIRDDDGNGGDVRRHYRRGRNNDGDGDGGDGRRCQRHERNGDDRDEEDRKEKDSKGKDGKEEDGHRDGEEGDSCRRHRYERSLQQAQPPQGWQKQEQ